MARYFFDLHECGTVATDEEGVERDGMAAVRTAALQAAREVMCAEVAEGQLCLSCNIEVRDETGATVLTLPFKEAVVVSGM